MRTTTFLCTLLTFVALLSGCVITTNNPGSGGNGGDGGNGGQGGGGGPGGSGGNGGGSSDHEATCYEPTAAEGTDSFEATAEANTHTFSFTVPNDAGGGYVEVRGHGKQLFMNILTDKGPDGDITGSSSGEGGVAASRFVATPGMTYLVRLAETSLVTGDPPQMVTYDWKFHSSVDCFEPNDTPAEARGIALDKPLRAHMLAGYVENAWPTYEAHYDYYQVQVDNPGTLRATLNTPIALSLDIYAADGETNVTGALILETEPGSIEAEVDAGTYYVLVHPFASLYYNDFDTGGEPAKNWVTPYELTVTHE
ncbi:hypothetical protein [Polyangium fumosum]|uniref:Uncharacterized protein n=1 Tax=Polyangium fumosum TaxID=889272 RepID=A0A4U1JK16_9BACT|nr:hypothetical protein [Polyangium fumosum]TKD13086.1 hypothetical protein E8A74_00585 [Polyangium fumosum]